MARRKVLRAWVAALTVTSGAAELAQATPKHASLRWNAPDSCPDDAALIAAVEGYLGQRLAESSDQQLAVAINVLQAEGGFSAKLGFATPGGRQERFLEHPECDKLMDAAALLVALAIDPERVRERQEVNASPGGAVPAPSADGSDLGPEPSPAPPNESNTVPPPTRPPPAAPPSPHEDGRPAHPSSSIRPNLAAVALAGIGTLPGFSPGLAAELGLRRGLFRAALVGRYWLPSTTEVAGAAPASIELSLMTAGVRACLLPRAGHWTLLGCAGADVGQMSGDGVNVAAGRPKRDTFGAVEASFGAAYSRAEFAPLAGLALTVPVEPPSFGVLRDGDWIKGYRPSGVGLAVFVGAAYGL